MQVNAMFTYIRQCVRTYTNVRTNHTQIRHPCNLTFASYLDSTANLFLPPLPIPPLIPALLCCFALDMLLSVLATKASDISALLTDITVAALVCPSISIATCTPSSVHYAQYSAANHTTSHHITSHHSTAQHSPAQC